jgi:hypothetical protein
VKTERARLELEGRASKEEKKLKEIAAAHTSKMTLLNEQYHIKAKDKEDREKAKLEAAHNKQKTDMAKLDSSVNLYHNTQTMSQPNGGQFPGGKQLLQVSRLTISLYTDNCTNTCICLSYFNNNRFRMFWPRSVDETQWPSPNLL